MLTKEAHCDGSAANGCETSLQTSVTSCHKHALRAAHAARCAGDQGKYWGMRHALIVNAARLAPEALPGYASDLALDVVRFQECVSRERHGSAIRRDIAEAQSVGISGTPSFVLGRTAGDAVEGVKIVGAVSYAVFEAKIRELLGTPAPRDRPGRP